MKKYNLVCPLRQVNPYRQQAKKLQENRIAPNVLNRQFKAGGPRTVLLTDITFIPRYSHKEPSSTPGAVKYTYVSVVMDAFTKEVLSCVCSTSYKTDFVLETVNQLLEKHGSELKTDTLIHSDAIQIMNCQPQIGQKSFSRMASFKLNGRKITERAVDAKIIEPMNIISEFEF